MQVALAGHNERNSALCRACVKRPCNVDGNNGEPRTQGLLFPERLDDWISEDNPVRVIDAFVEELDLEELGFEGAVPAETGRPAYHPATLLKIYIYGYLNRIQSSRRLEREAQRNVEVVWLTGRLMPDFKTIADFRRANGLAIRKVCVRFIELCRQMKLFSEAVVAIDGSKFKAVNNRDRNFTAQKIKSRLQHLEKAVQHYLDDLDRADREPAAVPEARVSQLKDKIAAIKAEMRKLTKIEEQLPKAGGQISLTDPDARSMNSAGKGTGTVGYNVQTAVDTKNHMIVAHDVINLGSDRRQLTQMAKLAREALGRKRLTALADRGYYSGEEIRDCTLAGMNPLVPKTVTSGARAEGRFDKRDFVYNAKRDEYRCPAGERAIWRFTRVEAGLVIHRYWSSACPRCPLKARCTPSDCPPIPEQPQHLAALELLPKHRRSPFIHAMYPMRLRIPLRRPGMRAYYYSCSYFLKVAGRSSVVGCKNLPGICLVRVTVK
jgi:transposase